MYLSPSSTWRSIHLRPSFGARIISTALRSMFWSERTATRRTSRADISGNTERMRPSVRRRLKAKTRTSVQPTARASAAAQQ